MFTVKVSHNIENINYHHTICFLIFFYYYIIYSKHKDFLTINVFNDDSIGSMFNFAGH